MFKLVFLLLLSSIILVLSYECNLLSNNVCKDIKLVGKYIKAGYNYLSSFGTTSGDLGIINTGNILLFDINIIK